ncbi:MAG: response regulator [Sphingobacterium sp.]
MNKFNQLKLQVIASTIVALLIIVFSYWYFLQQQTAYSDHVQQYMQASQKTFALTQRWEADLQQLSQYNAIDHQVAPQEIENLRKEVLHTIDSLTAPTILYQAAPPSIEGIKKISQTIMSNSSSIAPDSQESGSAKLTEDHAGIIEARIRFTNAVIDARHALIERREQALRKTRIYTAIFGTASLLIILLVVLQILRILNHVRKTSEKSRRLNHDLSKTSHQLEAVNWVLTKSSAVHNLVSSMQTESEIAKASLEAFVEALGAYAGTFYLRKTNSLSFQLIQSLGMDKRNTLDSFILGDGLLGWIADSKEYKILRVDDIKEVKIETGTIKHLQSDVILFPIVYQDYCIAVIELIGELPKAQRDNTIDYLNRTGRTVGSALHTRQNHGLLEELLTETQRQTEELEAQQEELRITNEELVYKTNLLEASEEELRVQQEELSQANKELNQKAAELERRNGELNAAHQVVEQKIVEVEQASKYKSEFMANMSHELRTPLNSILILAKLLQDNKHQNLSEDQIKYASVIHNAGSDLLQLINELLDLAKIEAGKVDIQEDWVNSNVFANNLEALFKEIAKEKQISFHVDIREAPTEFITDEYRIEQVLKNFLSNAFKFTSNQGKITLQILEESGHLHFSVFDTGKGISADKQHLIFDAFRQEDGSTSRKYGGTGLGLSISKEIASLLGGRITLESAPEKGSTFTLIIPHISAKSPQTVDTEQRLEETKEALDSIAARPQVLPKVEHYAEQKKDKTILIIEDDVSFAKILNDFAKEYGFDVLNAYDGISGIQLAKEHQPDAVILDVMLPLADGWEVLRKLKADQHTRQIPVHMMSAANFNKKEFLESGAIGFMPKPVTEESIASAFKNIKLNIGQGFKKILLIEDQEFQSELIKNAFAEQNINVIQAFTVESGLKKLEEDSNFDCIILDVKLPDGSGLEMLDQIKSNPKFEKLPVIINTAYELSNEQTERIMRHTQSMVLKSGKSNNRLIDEVNLFLNKLSAASYRPIKNPEKLENNRSTASTIEGKTVLIADDDMRNVFALTASLQQYNMHIEIANNGIEALAILSDPEKHIDIVLMDIMMPEMDGYEAIQEIRQQTTFNHLPIIAITAKAMKGDREKSIELGASDYISKPIDLSKLVSLMQVWLS